MKDVYFSVMAGHYRREAVAPHSAIAPRSEAEVVS